MNSIGEPNRAWLTHTTASRRWNFWLMWYVYPVLCILFITIGVVLCARGMDVIWAVFFLYVGAFCLWRRLRFPRKLRKLYKQQAEHFAGHMILGPTGMDEVRKNGTASSHYAWNAFDLWIDLPAEFLLIPGPGSFVRVPKDNLSQEQQDQLRGWLATIKKAK